MRLQHVIVFLVSSVALSSALYTQCSGGKEFENLEESVKISGCKRTYCRLRKKTTVAVEFKFKSDREIKSLVNTVSAKIAGIPFPFIGVDGENACKNIYETDGTTKTNCPLKANTDYVYKNSIDVLEIYPRLKIIVHWGLTSPNGDVMCFEVPAKITN